MTYDGYLRAWLPTIHRLFNRGNGLSPQAIANVIAVEIGRHPEKLYRWPAHWGKPKPSSALVRYVLERTGHMTASRVLTPRPNRARDRRIARMCASGYSCREVGEHFGLCRGRVSEIHQRAALICWMRQRRKRLYASTPEDVWIETEVLRCKELPPPNRWYSNMD